MYILLSFCVYVYLLCVCIRARARLCVSACTSQMLFSVKCDFFACKTDSKTLWSFRCFLLTISNLFESEHIILLSLLSCCGVPQQYVVAVTTLHRKFQS